MLSLSIPFVLYTCHIDKLIIYEHIRKVRKNKGELDTQDDDCLMFDYQWDGSPDGAVVNIIRRIEYIWSHGIPDDEYTQQYSPQ